MPVTEAVGGKLADLLIGALQRSVSVVFQKITRLEKIDLTIKGGAQKNPHILSAIKDFEIILGSYQGILTTNIHAFISELGKSGLIEAMAENALIKRESDDLKRLFIALYSRFVPAEQDPVGATALYDQMMISFGISLQEMSKDTILVDLLRVSHGDLASRLSSIDDAVRSLLNSPTISRPATFESLQPSLARIAKGLQLSYKNVRVETNRGPREVEINRIYIPPQLSLRSSPQNTHRMSEYVKAIGRDVQRVRSTRGRDISSIEYMSSETIGKLTYSELARSFQRVVILGDPGGGKSTICQKLCFDMAKDTSLMLQFRDDPRISADKQRLPLRIILRRFEQAREVDPQLDLLTYIARDLVHYAGGEPNEIKDCLNYLLENGRAVLAFDGLDEILDTSRRLEFVEIVTALCDRYPLCPALVTSRLVGYDDAPLGAHFEEVVLEKLSNDEVKTYVKKFMSVVGNKSKEDCEALSRSFVEQTERTASDLRRNPLMLGLMSWLYLQSGDVPANRPEIYKECSILLFERWDQKRGILADATTDFDRSQLFITLASKIYGDPKLSGGVKREWLSATLNDCFQEIYEDKARSFKATKSFVAFITGRAWILSEIGDGVFAFTHQTFLEYFFARYLDDGHDTMPALLRTLRPKIVKHEWNEVSHLATQLKGHRSLRRQEEAIKIIGSYIRDARMPKHQLALMNFGSRALEYLSPSELSIGSFIDDISAIAFERAKAGDYSSLLTLASCVVSARERREYVHEKIAKILEQSLFGDDADKAVITAEVISGYMTLYRKFASDDVHGFPEDFLKKFILSVREGVLARSNQSGLFMGLSWSWYNHFENSDLERFGIAPLYNWPSRSGIQGVSGITSVALLATGNYGRSKEAPVEKAQKVLADIASYCLTAKPVPKSAFKVGHFPIEPPTYIWREIYTALKGNELALMGAILARQIAKHGNSRFYRDHDVHLSRSKRRSASIESEEAKLLSEVSGESATKLTSIIAGEIHAIIDLDG